MLQESVSTQETAATNNQQDNKQAQQKQPQKQKQQKQGGNKGGKGGKSAELAVTPKSEDFSRYDQQSSYTAHTMEQQSILFTVMAFTHGLMGSLGMITQMCPMLTDHMQTGTVYHTQLSDSCSNVYTHLICDCQPCDIMNVM